MLSNGLLLIGRASLGKLFPLTPKYAKHAQIIQLIQPSYAREILIFELIPPTPLDKLELIIREKQIELQGLQAELNEALTGIESPDYEAARRLQPLIYGVTAEIERLEKLRLVKPTPHDFQSHLSRLLTDETCTALELWTHIKDCWNDVTIRVLEIRKLKNRGISCTLRLIEPADNHLNAEWTTFQLHHIGWKALRGERTFYYKTRLRSPDQFDAFCQMMSITLLEPLAGLWKHGQQFYRFQ